MARATFDGPILAGDQRFGPFRTVGYANMVQSTDLNLAVATGNNTAFYAGGSGQFVNGNLIPNSAATVYTPSATLFPSVVQAIPADTATNVYRGCVMYLPVGSQLIDIIIDVGVISAVAGGSAVLTTQIVTVSNNWVVAAGTPTYAGTAALSAAGRAALSTFTAAQITNQAATSQDILQANGPPVSQVVFTISYVGTGLDTRTSLTGRYHFTLRYIQLDGSIGTQTAYPNGNIG